MRGILTWIVLAVAACGASWAWHSRLEAEEHGAPHTCALHGSPGTHEPQPELSAEFVSAPQPPSSDLAASAYAETSRRARAYVAGDGDARELEDFWRSCGPIPPEHLERLLADLERRVELFDRMLEQHPPGARELPPAGGVWTRDDFFAEYAGIGRAEARFLVEECRAGRMREAPFIPVPPTVLDTRHTSAQMVPHHLSSAPVGYVARLEREREPDLFEARPRIFALAQEVAAADSGDPADDGAVTASDR